jgi:hypothetical protein
VIEDTRSVSLQAGHQHIGWPLAGALDPATLWLAGQGVRLTGFQVLPAVNADTKPLAARIVRSVTLTYIGGGRTRQGTLVAAQGQTAFVRVGHRIERVTANSVWAISWPAGGHGEHNDRLQLDISAQQAGQRALTATYQIAAPSWQASYTGRFDAKTGRLTLQATAVIDNSGGHRPLDARQAWLVAGDVARGGNNHPQPLRMAKTYAAAASAPQPAHDIYRYPLPGGLHVPAGVTRAIALMPPASLQAERRYRFAGYALSDTGRLRRHADIELSLTNTGNAPLPAGTVRVYAAGRAADLMGAAAMTDTPVGAPVRLTLGQAFDLTATHRVVKQASTANGQQSRTLAMTLRNADDTAKTATVLENLPAGAHIASAKPKPAANGTADTARWRQRVPAHGRKTLRYTIKWRK